MSFRATLAERHRVTDGRRFRLDRVDAGATAGIRSRAQAEQALERGVKELSRLQEMLYADDRWALLLIFQALDAAGKDSTIEHVMSGVNPQGCQVYSFKAPSAEELDHDFLWRCAKALPERGRIGIFNRSYYEEVLVVRVHPELLVHQRLPRTPPGAGLWKQRFEDVRGFERHLHRSGVAVRKFYLHMSKQEQKRRFLKRLDEPEKNWKFSTGDVLERAHWDAYMHAYEEMIRHTATPDAPWYVVPADHKWYARIVVADAVVDALESLELRFPRLDTAKRGELEQARRLLLEE
jgi:PPK2 family polyphosphate:nucleotide phosphotransferase